MTVSRMLKTIGCMYHRIKDSNPLPDSKWPWSSGRSLRLQVSIQADNTTIQYCLGCNWFGSRGVNEWIKTNTKKYVIHARKSMPFPSDCSWEFQMDIPYKNKLSYFQIWHRRSFDIFRNVIASHFYQSHSYSSYIAIHVISHKMEFLEQH